MLFGSVTVSVLLLTGTASAHVLSPGPIFAPPAPVWLAAEPACTMPAPDLSNLVFWKRYTKPGEPGAVMLPAALLAADHAGSAERCAGLERQKTYVVDLPSDPSDG